MREIIGLARIQQIDTRIDQNLSNLDSIKSKIENNDEIKNISDLVEAVKFKFTNAKKKLESSEKILLENSNKIEQSEANLYGGKIKNPKELQDIEKEIGSLKRTRLSLEEQLLQEMMILEEITKKLEATSDRLQAAESNFNLMIGELLTEKQTIMEEIKVLTEEKNATQKSLSDEVISIYDKLRTTKKGLAVASVTDGVCNSCGTTLTPAKQQSIKSSNELIYCSTCGRLLFSQ